MYLIYVLLAFIDAIAVFGTAVLTRAAYLASETEAYWNQYALAGIAGALLTTLLFRIAGIYAVTTPVADARMRISKVWTWWSIAMLLILLIGFFLKLTDVFSRFWFVAWYVTALAAMAAARVGGYFVQQKWLVEGKIANRVVIVGAVEYATKLIRTIRRSKDPTIRLLGFFDDGVDAARADLDGVPRLGGINEAVAYCRENRVDSVVVALPWTAEKRILSVLAKLRMLPIDIRLSPENIAFELINNSGIIRTSYTHLGNVPLLDVFRKPLTQWQAVLKEAEDRILGVLFLLLLSPVLAAVALMIKWDSPGPVFFVQDRYGFNNKLIKVYKFRSMHHHMTDHRAEKLTTKNDPRVTRLGRWLRKTSIDEFPQLINVIKGEMSIVGPRPHAISAKAANRLYEEVVAEYAARHRVKPGITGWAQVNGWRGETDTEEKIKRRVEHDLFYIENWSLFLDIKIILMTVFAVFIKRDNAY